MRITHLGQAGLLIEEGTEVVMIDPYLSDSVGASEPAKHRRVPVPEEVFSLRPTVMIFTHDHLDHYDPETVAHFLNETSHCLVLAPRSVWDKVRNIGGNNNFVLFDRGTSWTENGIRFTAVAAAHSDPFAIGVVIEAEGKTLYITGDTLYRDDIFAELPPHIHVLFLPVNGVGNNMNPVDAARFAAKVGADRVVPLHVGLFDGMTGEELAVPNRVLAKPFQPISLIF